MGERDARVLEQGSALQSLDTGGALTKLHVKITSSISNVNRWRGVWEDVDDMLAVLLDPRVTRRQMVRPSPWRLSGQS